MITVIVKQNENGEMTVLSTGEQVRVILVEEDLCGDSNITMNDTPCIAHEKVSVVDEETVKEIINSSDTIEIPEISLQSGTHHVTKEMLIFAHAYKTLTYSMETKTLQDLVNLASLFINDNGYRELEKQDPYFLDDDLSIANQHLEYAKKEVQRIAPQLFGSAAS